jgi:hypothetical protein
MECQSLTNKAKRLFWTMFLGVFGGELPEKSF